MEVVVLEIKTDAREVDNGINTDLLQLLGVTDPGSLQHQGSAKCSTADNDQFPSLPGRAFRFVRPTYRPGRDRDNPSSDPIFNYDTVNFCIAL